MTFNRVKGLTVTDGIGPYAITSSGSPEWKDWSVIPDGTLVDYVCVQAGVAAEIGRGIVTASGTTLSRLRREGGAALQSWTGGASKEIIVASPAETLSITTGKTDGLITSPNGLTPGTKLDVGKGVARSDDDTQNLWNDTEGFICALSSPWAEGSDQAKIVTGGPPAADDTWHLWMWGRVAGPTYNQPNRLLDIDFSFDKSASAPTAPGADWIFKQLIASYRLHNTLVEFRQWTQVADRFKYTNVTAAGAASPNRSWAVGEMSSSENIETWAPTGLKMPIRGSFNFQASFGAGSNVNREIAVTDPDDPAVALASNLYDIRIRAQSTDDPARSENVEIVRTCNTSAQLRIQNSNPTDCSGSFIITEYTHPRGSNQQ